MWGLHRFCGATGVNLQPRALTVAGRLISLDRPEPGEAPRNRLGGLLAFTSDHQTDVPGLGFAGPRANAGLDPMR